jgi:AraC family transcriptional regulator, regulatory protein of adaptative response / methylated-DNA-[protein]-cysteine methyltransferase
MRTIYPVNRAKSPKYVSDDARWQAIVKKEEKTDGHFFYSVNTTGVYCRPSCPSRRPNRENVAFHKSPEEAEKAGFRACKRCDPKSPDLAEQHAEVVATACRMIKEADEFPNLDELARAVKMSPGYFHRLFKAATGLTPKAYANAHRADRVQKALPRRETVTEAIYEAGYNSNGRFYAHSSKMLGMKPKEYRDGGVSNTIRFAIGECSLGSILVASSDKGVCAILMGNDPDALARDLQDRFPKANLVGADSEYEKLVAKVVGFIEAPKIGLDLPLDIRGTAFQRPVRRPATHGWPTALAFRNRLGQLRKPAVPMRSPSPSRVTECCARMEISPAMAGAWTGSAPCCFGKGWRHEPIEILDSGPRRRPRLGGDDEQLGYLRLHDRQIGSYTERVPITRRDVRHLSKHDCHGSSRLRPRRVQILVVPIAGTRWRIASGVVSAACIGGQSLESSHENRLELSRLA